MGVKNERLSGDSGKSSIPSIILGSGLAALVVTAAVWANGYDAAREPVRHPYDGPPVEIGEGAHVRDRIGSTLPCGYVDGDHVVTPGSVVTPGNSSEVLGYMLTGDVVTLMDDSNCEPPYYVRADAVTIQPTPVG